MAATKYEMETSTLNSLQSILQRYKLNFRTLNEDDIEISRRHNIKRFRIYYLYLPLSIGSIITSIGLLTDFVLLTFCGIPFLLYAVYGLGQITNAIKDNLNITTIKNGEIRISMNNVITTLSPEHIKDYDFKSEYIDDEIYIGQLIITDLKNKEHIILTLIDEDLSILNGNLDFLRKFIQTKMNASGNH